MTKAIRRAIVNWLKKKQPVEPKKGLDKKPFYVDYQDIEYFFHNLALYPLLPLVGLCVIRSLLGPAPLPRM